MKIACLVENLGTFGGTQKQFLRIAEHLSLLGHSLEIFTGKFRKECCLGIENLVKVNVVELTQKKPEEFILEFLFKCKDELARFEWIVVCDGYFTLLKQYYPAARVCWICNDAPFSHKPFVYGEGWKFRLKHLIRSAVYTLWEHRKVKGIDKIIVLDAKMQKAVRKIYNKHAEIIRSGIDLPEEHIGKGGCEEILRKYGLEKGRYVLALSIAYPFRNFEVLIRSSPDLEPGLKVLIIAPNPTGNNYSRQISKLASTHEKVTLNQDFISEDEKYHLLENALAFVFPNKDQTWGLAPLEAASVKTPVIVSTECGVTEVLQDNNTALIFDPDDHEGLAKKINLLYKDPSLRNRLKENAYGLIISELTWSNYAANITNYLKRIN